AKLVKQLFTQFFKTLNMDKWFNKVFPSNNEGDNAQETLSVVIANIIYVVILIPFISIALNALNIQTISRPVESVLDSVITMIPNVFIAIVLVVAGFYIGKLVSNLLTSLLRGTNINDIYNSLGFSKSDTAPSFDLANFIGKIVQVVIVLFFTVQALQIINLDVLNTIGIAIITYIPYLLSAVVILSGRLLVANLLGNWVKRNTNNAVSSIIIKVVIITFAIFMTLDQLQFATSIVNIAFLVILGGLMLAFAL